MNIHRHGTIPMHLADAYFIITFDGHSAQHIWLFTFSVPEGW